MIVGKPLDKAYLEIVGGLVVKCSTKPFPGAVAVSGVEAVAAALHKRARFVDGACVMQSKADYLASVKVRADVRKAEREAAIVARWNQSNKTAADRTAAADALLVNMGVSPMELLFAVMQKNTGRIDEVLSYVNGKLNA